MQEPYYDFWRMWLHVAAAYASVLLVVQLVILGLLIAMFRRGY